MFFDELSNDEWALVSALVSEGEVREHRRGRPRAHPRTIVNAVLWILSTGETWSKLPSHYPTVPTCRRRFNDWQMNGTLIEIVTRLAERGRSFAIMPTPPTAAPERPAQPVYECDRLRGVFWQNPESWNDPQARGDGASEGFLAVPRRLAEARDVVRANAPTPLSSSRAALPMATRSEQREHDTQPMVLDSSFTPVHDGRGYSIYAIARPVAGGMFRGWAEIIKEGRRVERSGLIGPRYGTVEEAAAYALEWSNSWISAQPTQVAQAAPSPAQAVQPSQEGQPVQHVALPAAQPAAVEPRDSSDIVRTPNEMNRGELAHVRAEHVEFRYADLQG
jgi:transposase